LFKAAWYFDLAASHKAKDHGTLHHHCDLRGAMAYLLRLILVAFVAAFSLSVEAAIPTVPSWYLQWNWENTAQRHYGASAADACTAASDAGNARIVSQGFQLGGVSFTAPKTCRAVSSTGVQVGAADAVLTGSNVCPANSTLSGSSCVCTSPFVEDSTHTSCVAPPTSAEKWKNWCQAAYGQALGSMNVPGRSTPGGCLTNINIVGSPIETPGYVAGDVPDGGGCSFLFPDSSVSWKDETGAYQTQGNPTISGGTCVQGNTPVPVDAPPNTDQEPLGSPNPCPDGFAGTLNGSSVCVKREPDKGIEGVQNTGTTNADGTSTSVKETTKCDGGMCTTRKETTTRDSAGVIIGTPKVEEKKETIGAKCNADPGNKVCATTGTGVEGGGGITGNCVAGFTVKGEDPILNAMALEQYKRNCEMLRTDTEPSTWLTAEGQKTTNVMADSPNNAEFSIGPGSFDTSDALGGGGCSLNKTVTVRGYSVALPFNVLCDPLAIFGQILVAFAFLLGARIVTRG
jgi:hypothetical protein